jgi:hypothetical protein
MIVFFHLVPLYVNKEGPELDKTAIGRVWDKYKYWRHLYLLTWLMNGS